MSPASASQSTAKTRAGAKITPLPGRFVGRCPAGTKNADNCHDVLTQLSTREGSLYFQLNKGYCSALAKESAGVWSFTPPVIFNSGAFTKKFVYNNMIPGHHNDTGAITISFSLKGRYTSNSTLRVEITGKVTHAVTPADDCNGVKFSELHVLKHVNY
ncbi:MAG: hypothetical protein ABI317_15760 [Gaiellales bacterium]